MTHSCLMIQWVWSQSHRCLNSPSLFFKITFPLPLSFVSLHHLLLSSLCLLCPPPCSLLTFSSRWSDSALLKSLNHPFLAEAITRSLMKRGRLPDTPSPLHPLPTQICILVLIKPTLWGFNERTSIIFYPSPNEFAHLSRSLPRYSWKDIYSADIFAVES